MGTRGKQADKNKQVNLIEGPILKSLVALAIPIMASSFLNTVYSITDMAWIGMLGARVVAGVGVGGMYVWFSQGLASLARMGGQVLVAQALGRKRRDEAKEYARASLQLVVVFGTVFSLICLLATRRLVEIFRLEDAAAVNNAMTYMRITCGLIIFSYLSAVLTGIYTAQGDSRTPLLANFIGLVLNMILDPVLILLTI